ncbi:MAG: NAD(P) transhydrogenase subunit alpha [Fibrobacteria bacterium]|nr:NAD(P) transhydrogenase subunit alpha [Fibrobacteria bacterium]
MKIFIPKETHHAETRVAIIPVDVAKLVKKGASITVETGIGEKAGYLDQEYIEAGATLTRDRDVAYGDAELVLRISKPEKADMEKFQKGVIHISYLDPYNEQELIDELAVAGTSAISLEMIPRTTVAQKMDALSSQASIAGYNAVIIAAQQLQKLLPMMMTPAGTISPSRVFVIGAGVAGLQAIATAKRLGARVEAFDTRPVVEEQVKSLGAKFVKVDLGETGQTKDGYAKALTPEQIKKQQEAMAKHCALSDIVITTAQLFGRKAPVIITEEMVKQMKPGSIIVDMAVESGGNVEKSKPGETVDINGVKVLGIENLAGHAAFHASQMLSSNFFNLLDDNWDDEKKSFILNQEEEIIKGCLITHGGEIVNEAIKKFRAGGK